MPTTFKYKAIDHYGKFVRGNIEAINQTDLELRLSHLGLDLIDFRITGKPLLRFAWRRVSRHELINFTFHLEQLINAGVPLLDGLRDLRESINSPIFRDVVTELVTAIEGGKTFSQALAGFGGIFNSVFVSMIRVGEESGQLGKILKDLTEMQRWQDELITQTRKAMIYPLFVAVVVFITVICQMVFLVPELVRFVESTGANLPLHTQALIATSDFFVAYWYIVLFAPVLLGAILKICIGNSLMCRYYWDAFKLKAWFIGPIIYKIKLARFANYFALLYSAGITVLDSIALCRRVVDNVVLNAALERVYAQISEGEGISESFAQTDLFPALVIRMLKVGERSGAMDSALLNVSYFYNRQVSEAITGLAPILAPILVVLIALVMAWIMLSVLGPIYEAVVTIGAF